MHQVRDGRQQLRQGEFSSSFLRMKLTRGPPQIGKTCAPDYLGHGKPLCTQGNCTLSESHRRSDRDDTDDDLANRVSRGSDSPHEPDLSSILLLDRRSPFVRSLLCALVLSVPPFSTSLVRVALSFAMHSFPPFLLSSHFRVRERMH